MTHLIFVTDGEPPKNPEGPWVELNRLGHVERGDSPTVFVDVNNPMLGIGDDQYQRRRLIYNLDHMWAWGGLVPEAEGRPCMRVHFTKPEGA
jgi:hypothetical protein